MFISCRHHSGKFQLHWNYRNRNKQGGGAIMAPPGKKHQNICPGKIGLNWAWHCYVSIITFTNALAGGPQVENP